MSILSAQCDELRAMAESVGLEVPLATTLMMEAADAIDRLDAENAELRDELDSAKHDISLFSERIVELGAENTKLREFIGLKETCWKYVGWCNECPYNGVDDEHGDCNCTVREKVSSLARELGIEVTA